MNEKKGIELKSIISAVTVYSDRALVTLVASNELSKGEHCLLFDKLPEAIEPDSIQVDGTGDAILSDIKFKSEHFAEVTDDEKKALLNEKLKLEDSIREINDKITQVKNEKVFIENIANKLTGQTEKSKSAVLDPEKWKQMVEFYRSKQESLDKERQR